MEKIQFIQTSPEELENRIFSRVKTELEELKKEFQPKEPTEYLTRNEARDLLKVDLSTLFTTGHEKANYVHTDAVIVSITVVVK